MPALEVLDEPTWAGLLDSMGGDVGFLKELVDAYIASTPELFAAMRQGAEAGDGPALQRAAHSLKTGSASMGALMLAARCKELEDMGRSGALDGAEGRIDAARAAYDEAAQALRARVETA